MFYFKFLYKKIIKNYLFIICLFLFISLTFFFLQKLKTNKRSLNNQKKIMLTFEQQKNKIQNTLFYVSNLIKNSSSDEGKLLIIKSTYFGDYINGLNDVFSLGLLSYHDRGKMISPFFIKKRSNDYISHSCNKRIVFQVDKGSLHLLFIHPISIDKSSGDILKFKININDFVQDLGFSIKSTTQSLWAMDGNSIVASIGENIAKIQSEGGELYLMLTKKPKKYDLGRMLLSGFVLFVVAIVIAILFLSLKEIGLRVTKSKKILLKYKKALDAYRKIQAENRNFQEKKIRDENLVYAQFVTFNRVVSMLTNSVLKNSLVNYELTQASSSSAKENKDEICLLTFYGNISSIEVDVGDILVDLNDIFSLYCKECSVRFQLCVQANLEIYSKAKYIYTIIGTLLIQIIKTSPMDEIIYAKAYPAEYKGKKGVELTITDPSFVKLRNSTIIDSRKDLPFCFSISDSTLHEMIGCLGGKVLKHKYEKSSKVTIFFPCMKKENKKRLGNVKNLF